MRAAKAGIYLVILGVVFAMLAPYNTYAAQYIFPVIGSSSFSNDYDAPRAGGPHHAIDIIAKKGQAIVSATNGTITYVATPQPSWGYAVFVKSDAGYTYAYLHMNNDTPGTDDARGGEMHAYAADMKAGNRVVRGQLLGWVGDSGNAEGTVSHLHFEVTDTQDRSFNPYNSLRQAEHIKQPFIPPALAHEVLPFGNNNIGLNVAIGNTDANTSTQELVVGAGKGGGPRIRVYDQNRSWMGYNFYAYDASYKGGVDVAVGDMDGDGVGEVVTGSGPGAPPRIRIFKLGSSSAVTKIADFETFRGHTGGIRVAAGDLDNDGVDEVIASADAGGGPRVNVMNGSGQILATAYVYDPGYRGGVDVASADVMGTNSDEVIVVPGKAGQSLVKVFNENLVKQSEFKAHRSSYAGGVRVSAGNVITGTAKAEIVTARNDIGEPVAHVFDSSGNDLRPQFKINIEQWWQGHFDAAAGSNKAQFSVGVNRRASLRDGS